MNAQEIKSIIASVSMKREGYTFTTSTDKYDTVRVELRDESGSLVWRKLSCESDFEFELTKTLERYTVQTQAVIETTKEEVKMTKQVEVNVAAMGAQYAEVNAKALNVRILKLTKAENIVYSELAAFSREALAYVLRTKDITPVSMLLGVDDKTGKPRLTRNNQVVAMHFFGEFLPFTSEGKASDGTLVFGKLKGERTLERCTKAINDFLYNPDANIWTWAKENVQTEKKPVDYAAKIGQAITSAMDEKKGNMSKQEVLATILRNGIDLNDLLAVAEQLAKAPEEKAA